MIQKLDIMLHFSDKAVFCGLKGWSVRLLLKKK